MTCGVLTQTIILQNHADIPAICGSKGDLLDSRETLDFEFESDTMSGSNRSAVVANIGVGLNGKLLRAVMHNKPGSVKYYLKCGGNPNVTTPDKRSALHLAVLSGHMKTVKRLLDAGANPSPLDQIRNSPLHFACSPPQIGAVETLLHAGADPNAGSQPQSVLHCAILGGSGPVIKRIVDAGADVNVIGFYDYVSSPLSPLGLAFYQEDWRNLVPILLHARPRTDNILGTCTTATIFEAILYTSRDTEVLRYLIQNGCIPSVKDLQSKPFLSFRCRTFRRSLVALLLRLAQEESHGIQTVRSLLDMLEASGYQLRKDAFCRHLMDFVSRVTSLYNSFPVSWESGSTDAVLSSSQIDYALRPFHWAGLGTELKEDLVIYVNELVEKLSQPPEIPTLASLCRMRVRGRLFDAHKVYQLQKFADRLPLPSVHKRFLMLEDF